MPKRKRVPTAVQIHKRTSRSDVMHSRVHGVESNRTRRRKDNQSFRLNMRNGMED